jgi:pimeloyl-ACP methyl ester carboxylesterase
LAHPERVRSLVLAGTCAFPHAVDPDDEVLAALTTRTSIDREASARVTIPFIYHPSTPRDRVEEDLVIWLEQYPSKEGYEGQRRASAGYDNRDRLAALDLPVLVIHGDADRLVPTGNGVDLARLIPGARYVEIGDASHNLFTDQPERTLDVIVRFIDALDS